MNDPGRNQTWSRWDLKLVHAYHVNQLFEVDGHPIHIEESPDIIWTAKRRTLRSAAVVEAEQEKLGKSKAKNHGVRISAMPKLKDGAKWPTRAEWAKRKEQPDDPEEKMANLRAAQEERARIKLIEMGLETLD